MKNLSVLFVCFLLCASMQLSAQNQYSGSIKESLHNYQQALLVNDFETAASHLHPSVVEKGGGRALYADILKNEVKSYSDAGIKFMDYKTLDPGAPVQAGSEIHCVVPQEITMLFNKTYFIGKEHLLAASMDEGKTWYFVDLKTFDVESLKEFIPNFNVELEIPSNPPMEEMK